MPNGDAEKEKRLWAASIYREYTRGLATLLGVTLGLLVSFGNANKSGSQHAARVALLAMILGIISGTLATWFFIQEEVFIRVNESRPGSDAGIAARVFGSLEILSALVGLIALAVYGWGRLGG
jgi:hypothetical protein